MEWKIKARELAGLVDIAIDNAEDPDDVMMAVDDLATYLTGETTDLDQTEPDEDQEQDPDLPETP